MKTIDRSADVSQLTDNEGLKTLADLGNELIKELEIQEELERKMGESKAKALRIQDVAIPKKMNDLGLDEIKLKSGQTIQLKPVFGASVPDERKPQAWAWLRENGHGALIKVTLGLSFGMGEEKVAQTAKNVLDDNGIPFEEKEDVHAATLKAFVTEQYEKGLTFPEALFGAFTKTIARIKSNKK